MKKIFIKAIMLLLIMNTPFLTAAENDFDMVIQKGHYSYVYLDFSRDGKYIYSASDKMIIIRTLEGQIIKEFEGHKDKIHNLTVAPDNSFFVTVSSDKTAKVWSMKGELLYTLNHEYAVGSLAISPDSKLIATADYTNYCKFIPGTLTYNLCNTFTIWTSDGKEYHHEGAHGEAINRLLFTRDGKTLITCSTDSTMKLWDVEGKKLKSTIKSSQDCTDIALTEDNRIISVNYNGNIMEIWNLDGSLYKKINRSFRPLRLLQEPGKDRFISYSDQGIAVFNEKGDLLKNVSQWDRQIMSQSGFTSLVKHPSKNIYACGLDNKAEYDIILFDNDFNVTTRMKKISSTVLDIVFVPGTDTFFTGTSDMILKKWDINSLSGTSLPIPTTDNAQSIKLAVSGDGKHMVSTHGYIGSGDYWIDIHNLDKGSPEYFSKRIDLKYKDTGAKWVYALAFHPDNKKFFVGCTDNTTKIYNLEGKLLKTMDCDRNSTYDIAISTDGNSVLTCNWRTLLLWDKDGNRIKDVYSSSSDKNTIDSIAYNIKKDIFVSLSKDGFRFFSKKGDLINHIKADFPDNVFNFKSCLDVSPDGNYMATNTSNGEVQIRDKKGNLLKTYSGHTNTINRLKFTPDSQYLVSVGSDSKTMIWNFRDDAHVTLLSRKNDWIVYNEEGYFDSSKNGGDLVLMVKSFMAYGLDQFAAKYNRPDILLKKLGLQNDDLMDHFKQQHEKRLKRLGLSESDFSSELHAPKAEIIESKVHDNIASVNFKISDDKYNLMRYNVYVNDVPIFGASGKNINSQSKEINEKIILTPGRNKIEVTCLNQKGVESLRALTFAEYNQKARGDLYYIGFGVSKYKDEMLNLKYADKDARDLNDAFTKMKDKYKNVYTKVYLNEEVTVENIRASKSFLDQAKEEDTFVLFIAGHGMHDNDKFSTYYYLTHNADLKNLSETAADFGIIEDLLQGISPRNKLFLMDTCESGEVEDAVQNKFYAMAGSRGIKARTARGLSVIGKISSDKKRDNRSYLLEKDRYIYNDLLRRSGAIIFSSSRGGEFSYESDSIQNGYFTYELLRGMAGTKGDKNKDGVVSVDELREYVIKNVSESTGGLQNPVVDRDNLFQKFGFPAAK